MAISRSGLQICKLVWRSGDRTGRERQSRFTQTLLCLLFAIVKDEIVKLFEGLVLSYLCAESRQAIFQFGYGVHSEQGGGT